MAEVVDLQSRRPPPSIFELVRDTLCAELGMRPHDHAARVSMARALAHALDRIEREGFGIRAFDVIPVSLPQLGDVVCFECGAPGGIHQGTCDAASSSTTPHDELDQQ